MTYPPHSRRRIALLAEKALVPGRKTESERHLPAAGTRLIRNVLPAGMTTDQASSASRRGSTVERTPSRGRSAPGGLAGASGANTSSRKLPGSELYCCPTRMKYVAPFCARKASPARPLRSVAAQATFGSCERSWRKTEMTASRSPSASKATDTARSELPSNRYQTLPAYDPHGYRSLSSQVASTVVPVIVTGSEPSGRAFARSSFGGGAASAEAGATANKATAKRPLTTARRGNNFTKYPPWTHDLFGTPAEFRQRASGQ